MTCSLLSNCFKLDAKAARSNCSQRMRSEAFSSTSSCMIGTSPFANAHFATSSCCETACLMPSVSGAMISIRALVPKHPKATAFSTPALTCSTLRIMQTPRDSGIKPTSIRTNGITFLTSHRYLAQNILSTLKAISSSERTTAIMREPLNAEFIMSRIRIFDASALRVASLAPALTLPYCCRTVLRASPLLSMLARKPSCVAMRDNFNWCSFIFRETSNMALPDFSSVAVKSSSDWDAISPSNIAWPKPAVMPTICDKRLQDSARSQQPERPMSRATWGCPSSGT
mmetsp:Transcript_24909/g.69426  ORF Transcript_24909/g.69426 Transcript_24909/m.69426 type:complete len:285 (+) Transcript_24909:709-1563(+)